MKALCFALTLAISTPALAGSPKKPKASLPRTARSKWSENGWKNLKWGMGPGDVKDALNLKVMMRDSSEEELPPEVEVFLDLWPEKIFDRPMTASFRFRRGMLESISIWPFQAPKEICRSWSEAVLSTLKEKYDKTAKDGSGCFDGKCAWGLPSFVVAFVPDDSNPTYCVPQIVYADPAHGRNETNKL